PYFVFGDKNRAVDLWFVDLARGNEVKVYKGKGSNNIKPSDETNVTVSSKYHFGKWSVIFKRKRRGRYSFDEKAFVPIAFSVWDGFNKERGNKRALSSWYHVYLKPTYSIMSDVIWPVSKGGGTTLILLVLIIVLIRKKYK
ncbi:MAG: hypothetical protein OEZ36_07140, partial [Spirochaetota bacterium]|nr:hypothetical protein [Spirochaetota bacterium]